VFIPFPTPCPFQDIVTLLRNEKFLLLISTRGLSGAARTIGTSERTIQRAAAYLGTNIRALVAESHRKAAEDLFREGRAVSAVAESLGYTRAISFSRFISREFGMTPSMLRRHLIQDRLDAASPTPSSPFPSDAG
jgi:AraC-like DNA-binding protein